MRQTAGFMRNLFHIVVPAIAVAAIGLAVLVLQYMRDTSRVEDIREARALNAADEMRDAVREAGAGDDLLFERFDQSRFIDDRTARAVDQEG